MTEPETIPKSSFVWPADYYSAPTPQSAFPPVVTYGCGLSAAALLALIFAGGVVLSQGGFTYLMDMSLGMSVSEMRGNFGKDVPATRKQSLETEVETMREHLRNDRVAVVALQPFLETLRSALFDEKVTEQEARALEEVARKINGKAKG
jgi:hypothetical protein